jgi:predicted HD phosphohydrolase
MTLQRPADVADAIVDLYRRRGTSNYDESVTQNAHALQCATLATAKRYLCAIDTDYHAPSS